MEFSTRAAHGDLTTFTNGVGRLIYGELEKEDGETRTSDDALVSPFGDDNSDPCVFFPRANGDQDRDVKLGATPIPHVSEQMGPTRPQQQQHKKEYKQNT